MNNVSLIGRLTRDPELRYTKGDDPKAVTRFTVAVNRRFNRDKADFIGCQAWGKLADIVAEHCTKGSQVGVVGRIERVAMRRTARLFTRRILWLMRWSLRVRKAIN